MNKITFQLLVFTCFVFCSCSSGSEGGDDPGTGTGEQKANKVNISLRLNETLGKHISLAEFEQLYATYDMRCIVEVYPESSSSVLTGKSKRVVTIQNSYTHEGAYAVDEIALSPGRYTVLSWIDFVPRGTKTDKYYNASDLQNIRIVTSNTYTGFNIARWALAGKAQLNISGETETQNLSVTMKPPFVTYRIQSTGLNEYLQKQPAARSLQELTARVSYDLYLPMGYNTYLQAPNNMTTGVNYTHPVTAVSDDEALLASDLIFASDNTFYQISLTIFTPEGTPVASVSNLEVNMKPEIPTIISDDFLNKNSSGGIGIGDGFDDEIVVPI